MRWIALLLLVAAWAGCVADGPVADGPVPDPESGPATPLRPDGDRPDGQQVLADLKAFTDTAPRRYDNLFEHDAARDWLESTWTAAGLNVTRDRFTGAGQTGDADGQNIVAALPGDSNITLLIGAHYDSAVTSVAGAYDDGTGTMLVVELARVAATWDWNHTLVFVLFDQEEAGLVGSSHMAEAMRDENVPLRMMLNYDMVGINWPVGLGGTTNPIPLDFYAGGSSESAMAATWSQAAEAAGYPTAATTTQTGLGGGSSDHGPFRNADFDAAWLRGALIGSYAAYHNADTVEAMTVIAGGSEDNLVAGFQTVLDLSLAYLLAVDGQEVPAMRGIEDQNCDDACRSAEARASAPRSDADTDHEDEQSQPRTR